MQVRVNHVDIPAMSTIGRCTGIDEETGKSVTFGADHRPARDIGEAVVQATDDSDLPVCEVEAWQVLSVSES